MTTLFQSAVFSTTVAALTDCKIEVIETTGAAGAARGAGYGIGLYASLEEAMEGTEVRKTYTTHNLNGEYRRAYELWKSDLNKIIADDNI